VDQRREGKMALFEQLEKWKRENPDDAKKLESLLQAVEKTTAFTYQPLVLPYLQITTDERTPSLRMH
jgi:hypothetical protein